MEMRRFVVLVLVFTVFVVCQVKAKVDIQKDRAEKNLSALSQDIQPKLVICMKKKASSVQYRRRLADENAVASSSDKQASIHVAIIIACVVTAVVTFIFALLLFLCCHKRLGINVGQDSKDGDSLLAASTSDYSNGSANSAVLQSSFHRMSFQSCRSNISDKEQAVSLEENVESDVVDVSVERLNTLPVEEPLNIEEDHNIPCPPLTPPPGRIPPPPALPTLKPLPDEPQTSPSSFAPAPPRPPPPPSPCARTPPSPLLSPSAPAPPPPLSPCAPAPPPPPGRKPSGGGPTPPPPPAVGGGGPPPPPPPAGGTKPGVRPPSLPKGGVQPPLSPLSGGMKVPRAKLKPFFWDKVLTHPGRAMVWHHIKAGSFQCNEEMMETLFGYVPPDKSKASKNKDSSSHDVPKFIQLIDPKKAQNLSILMRALNITTEEVCDALEEGHELPPELLENLLKMAPTPEEELKLRTFSGQFSQLGPAERFLKVLVDIPFAFKRMETLHFMCSLEEEVRTIKESLTLEAACTELKDSRLFLKLLEAVLKTGNRMNDGTFRGGAQAFKLDTLLKLSDVKGVDGKTTLLHFVVLEIIRSEGIRASRGDGCSTSFSTVKSIDDFTDSAHHDTEEMDAEDKMRALGLQVVSGLSGEMEDVKKAAGLDGEILSASVAKLGNSMAKTRNFLNTEMKSVDDDNCFHQVLKCFVEEIDEAVMILVEEEKRIAELVKSTADYFHGKPGKEEGLRLFTVVRDFLIMLDKACAQVAENFKKQNSITSSNKSHNRDPLPSKESSSKQNSKESVPQQLPADVRQKFINATQNSQVDGDFSSDDDDDDD